MPSFVVVNYNWRARRDSNHSDKLSRLHRGKDQVSVRVKVSLMSAMIFLRSFTGSTYCTFMLIMTSHYADVFRRSWCEMFSGFVSNSYNSCLASLNVAEVPQSLFWLSSIPITWFSKALTHAMKPRNIDGAC